MKIRFLWEWRATPYWRILYKKVEEVCFCNVCAAKYLTLNQQIEAMKKFLTENTT